MKHLLALSLALACAPLLRAAPYQPAATASTNWTPNVTAGVGVPGGIPARATIFTTITSTGNTTDRVPDIQAALLACPDGQTVLLGPGVFWLSYNQFSSGHLNNRTLRGSGSDPATGTVLKFLSGSNGLNLRGSENYQSTLVGDVTGTPVKGDTVLAVTNAGSAVVGRIIQLYYEDDDTLPLISVGAYNFQARQVALITAVDSGAGTVTIQPALIRTPVKRTGGALAMRWSCHTLSSKISGFGLEDMVADGTDFLVQSLVRLVGAHASWIKNVRMTGQDNYALFLAEIVQCEIRDSWIGPNVRANWASSSHAGITISDLSSCLIENNVILRNLPLIEVQGGGSSGNVYGYNFGLQGANFVAFSYHSAGSYADLWEGNSCSGMFADGYFGAASDHVLYRNDWHGNVPPSTQPGYPVFMPRFTRRWEVVGNQLGRPGITLNIQMGTKTAFNEGTTGVANNYSGDPHVDTLMTGILTTRTSDSAGVITFDTTLGSLSLGSPIIDDISLVSIRWGTTVANYAYREGVTRGAVDTGALTLTISGGAGTVLPAQGTPVRVFTGPNGYHERDDAVAASTILLGNYQYSDSAIPAPQALGSTTLPASLYRTTAPSFMSGYNWPPYDPLSPDPRYAAIPAGARYEASLGGGGTPTYSPARLGPMGARRR